MPLTIKEHLTLLKDHIMEGSWNEYGGWAGRTDPEALKDWHLHSVLYGLNITLTEWTEYVASQKEPDME